MAARDLFGLFDLSACVMPWHHPPTRPLNESRGYHINFRGFDQTAWKINLTVSIGLCREYFGWFIIYSLTTIQSYGDLGDGMRDK